MNMTRQFGTFCLTLLMSIVLTTQSNADTFFFIEIFGEVEFNQISGGQLGNVNVGESVYLSALIDPSDFVDSPNFPTRGYPLENKFGPGLLLQFENEIVTLQDPFPANATPFFVIRNNDPAVDGFFLSTNIDNPFGIPLDQTGVFTQFTNDFSVTYLGDTLPSLNIEEAQGDYDFTGLTVFNWTINDGPFNPLGIIFTSMHITEYFVDPACPFDLGDVNHDGSVNLLDVDSFVTAVLTNEVICEADINLDGIVDLLDVDPFVTILGGG